MTTEKTSAKKFAIRETITFEGKSRSGLMTECRNTSRGWRDSVKLYKTRGGAQAWINRRMRQIEGTAREGVESYEVVEY